MSSKYLRQDLKSANNLILKDVKNNHQTCSVKEESAHKNFANATENHLSQSLFFHRVAGWRLTTLSKKRRWQSSFPMNFTKFVRIFFA